MLHLKREDFTTRIQGAQDRLPHDQYLYLLRVAARKHVQDITAMELSEICRCLQCLPTDIAEWK
jgi:hypothetical protein